MLYKMIQEDIDKAKEALEQDEDRLKVCPISQMMNRIEGDHWITNVWSTRHVVNDDDLFPDKQAYLPDNAIQFISAFDHDKEVKPIEIELEFFDV